MDRLLELERANFKHYALGKRQLRYHVRNTAAVFLVAELGGEVVGDALGLVRRHQNGVSGRVYSLVVDKKVRGLGIGKRLFEGVVAALEQRAGQCGDLSGGCADESWVDQAL